MTDTNTLAPTDAEILDVAEDFRSQHMHGGTTFDAFDEIGFTRAALAKWGGCAHASSEPVERQPLTDEQIEALPTWNPIETAPKDRSKVLLLRQQCGSVANGFFFAEAYAGKGAWIWPYIHKNPTHWMPRSALPAAITDQHPASS